MSDRLKLKLLPRSTIRGRIAGSFPVPVLGVDGDYGDITVSGTGSIWTIDQNVVTYAKLQDISAVSKLLGRGSLAGAGDPEEITLGAGLTMTGTVLSSSGGAGVTDGDKGDITVTPVAWSGPLMPMS